MSKGNFITKLRQRTLSIVIFMTLWEILPRLGIVERIYLPPLSEVIQALFSLLTTGELYKHISISVVRSAKGFGLAIAIGIPLGVLIGWNDAFAKNVDPLLQLFRQTSSLALLPAFILFLGIGETTKTVIIFWGSLWPILMNTIAGVRNTPPLLIKMSRSLGESQFGLIRKIILPSASPFIFTGLKLSASLSLVLLTAAEMVGANTGIGYLVLYSQQIFRVANVYASIVTIAIMGLLLNYVINRIEQHALYWREEMPE